jgi:hypothetical protein
MKYFLLSLLIILIFRQCAVADLPAPASQEMVVDGVAEGLRRYRTETDEKRRRAILWKLAPTRDPRVALALGEFLESADLPYPEISLLAQLYLPEAKRGSTDAVWDWWRENQVELRRLAGGLPR